MRRACCQHQLSFLSCVQNSLKTATDCCRRKRQIQRDSWGSGTLHVSLNNACTRTVCKIWFGRNTGHLTLQTWVPWRYHIWGAMHEPFLEVLEAKSSCWIKRRIEKGMRQFSAGPIHKGGPSFRNRLCNRVRKGSWTLRRFFSTQMSNLGVFPLSW